MRTQSFTTALFLGCSLLCHVTFGQWQSLPKEKQSGRHPSDFCYDCGNSDGYVEPVSFDQLLDSLSEDWKFSYLSGRCYFRIIVDTSGRAFVLSYRGDLSRGKAEALAKRLSAYKGWHPAYVNGEAKAVSFTGAFDWEEGGLNFSIIHVDKVAARENFNDPGRMKITNTQYKYRNKPTEQYAFRVWTKANSALPYDMGSSITVDKSGTVWEGTFNGLARLQDNGLQVYTRNNSVFDSSSSNLLFIRGAATDSANNKWFVADDKIYEFDNRNWRVFDSSQTGVKGVLRVTVAATGKVLVSGANGFSIYNGESWSFMDPVHSHLPSSKVLFANVDSRGRLWIGTYKGLVMMEGDKAVDLTAGQSFLTGLTIIGMAEDADGNLWFATHAFDRKAKGGLAELDASGNWRIYDTYNSGLPANQTVAVLFNKQDNALWISVDNVGLVRFDRNKDWSLFTLDNSPVPSSVIFGISEDGDGNLWCATNAGLLEVSKKEGRGKKAVWARP